MQGASSSATAPRDTLRGDPGRRPTSTSAAGSPPGEHRRGLAVLAGPPARERLAATALAAVYVLLAVSHAAATTLPGRAFPASLLAAQDVLIATLLLARRSSRAASSRRGDRVIAVAALVLPLGLHPPGGVPAGIPAALEIVGLLLALLATATLGRHLGVLPAVRGITTRGVYAVVRHPMYAAYLLLFAAYVVGAPTPRNACLALAASVLLVVRLRAEEAVLGRYVDYRAYCRRVPWRLVPGCY
jgi:protein-S-isoprenylcysteine O-methyltransferase Ste14